MRISDWSSDVCSSDLAQDPWPCEAADGKDPARILPQRAIEGDPERAGRRRWRRSRRDRRTDRKDRKAQAVERGEGQGAGRTQRSEEHTSELQSLMRTSYAVFCLKKQNKQIVTNSEHTCIHQPENK